MPKYKIHGTITGTKYIGEVEAKNEKEAELKAWELEGCYVSVCHQCSKEIEDPEVTEIQIEEI